MLMICCPPDVQRAELSYLRGMCMNVMMVNSLNTYTKNMKMQMKWHHKQTSGDYKADGKTALGTQPEASGLPGMKKKDASAEKMSQIRAKMMGGKRLSSSDLEYLKEHDPQLYQKARSIEMEREAYERELKQCKTKEEVQRVKTAHAAAAMAEVENVETNPNIPKGKKLEMMMEILQKTNAMGDTERKFIESGEYKRLPKEAELRKAEKDLEEAKKAEQNIDDKTDGAPDEVRAEDSDEESLNREAEAASGQEAAAGLSDGETKPTETEVRAAKEAVFGREKTRLEAEVTPEARKVKRARAQAAYARSSAPRADVSFAEKKDIIV